MIDKLDLKIRQMHEALGGLEERDLSSIKPEQFSTANGYYWRIDFSQGHTDAELANIASLLVHNIASLKDHLKAWCAQYGREFRGDDLINTDKDVAIVHDLWNIDKHVVLNKEPRSGYHPKIVGLRKTLNISAGTSAGSGAMVTFDPQTGEMKTQTEGEGGVSLVVSGQVVDSKDGAHLGDFAEICERAAAAWERELAQAGIAIPAYD